MPSEKGRIVAGSQKAIRRRFSVTRVSTGNVPTLPAIFPDGIAPVGRVIYGSRIAGAETRAEGARQRKGSRP